MNVVDRVAEYAAWFRQEIAAAHDSGRWEDLDKITQLLINVGQDAVVANADSPLEPDPEDWRRDG